MLMELFALNKAGRSANALRPAKNLTLPELVSFKLEGLLAIFKG